MIKIKIYPKPLSADETSLTYKVTAKSYNYKTFGTVTFDLKASTVTLKGDDRDFYNDEKILILAQIIAFWNRYNPVGRDKILEYNFVTGKESYLIPNYIYHHQYLEELKKVGKYKYIHYIAQKTKEIYEDIVEQLKGDNYYVIISKLYIPKKYLNYSTEFLRIFLDQNGYTMKIVDSKYYDYQKPMLYLIISGQKKTKE